jgi:hypothetical protein
MVLSSKWCFYFFVALTIIETTRSDIFTEETGPEQLTPSPVIRDWISYKPGDGPIIIVVSHDGDDNDEVTDESLVEERPNTIGGCYSPTPAPAGTCYWLPASTPCPTSPPSSRDTSKCGITISRDTYCKDLGEKVQTYATCTYGGHTYHPHYIYTNLKRTRIDTNRDMTKGACCGDTDCEDAYDAFNDFIQDAITDVRAAFHFGIILDIHGHNQNNFTMLGYRVLEDRFDDDAEINAQTRATIEGLKERNFAILGSSVTAASIIKGDYSLGTLLMNKRIAWRVTPSTTYPNPFTAVGTSYFSGDYVIDKYSSDQDEWGNEIDAVQIEIPQWIRWNTYELDQFAQDLAEATREWINYWHRSSLLPSNARIAECEEL